MTIDAFLDLCEKSWSEQKSKLGPRQKEIYAEKLKRFASTQLDAIFEKVLELSRTFPKIRDIYDAAGELGFLAVNTVSGFQSHAWTPTLCNLCHGEGRLLVTWDLEFTADRRELQKLRHIVPYSSLPWNLEAGQFTSLFRCQCPAGEARTIPPSWPRWSRETEPTRILGGAGQWNPGEGPETLPRRSETAKTGNWARSREPGDDDE